MKGSHLIMNQFQHSIILTGTFSSVSFKKKKKKQGNFHFCSGSRSESPSETLEHFSSWSVCKKEDSHLKVSDNRITLIVCVRKHVIVIARPRVEIEHFKATKPTMQHDVFPSLFKLKTQVSLTKAGRGLNLVKLNS